MSDYLLPHELDRLGPPPAPGLPYGVAGVVVEVEALIATARRQERDAEFAEDRSDEYHTEAELHRSAAQAARATANELLTGAIADPDEVALVLARLDEIAP